ncbi:MAG: hypothetical protein DCC63_13575 [Nitrospira sp.]|nr:MAG: hypothetical protein DCC63_13575 [Nitrospira sp.]
MFIKITQAIRGGAQCILNKEAGAGRKSVPISRTEKALSTTNAILSALKKVVHILIGLSQLLKGLH